MATDYTTNYHLDKYTALDKPNLRDQYNAAMDKIDLALLSANTNAAEAKNTSLQFEDRLEDVETINNELLSKVSKKPYVFPSVAAMQDYDGFQVGDICFTEGFRNPKDDGSAFYSIDATGTVDNVKTFACGELYASYISTGYCTPEQFGAYGDGTHDDYLALQTAINTRNFVLFQRKTYCTAQKLVLGARSINLGICSIKAIAAIEAVFECVQNDIGMRRIVGGNLNCNSLAQYGIKFSYSYASYVESVRIEDATKACIIYDENCHHCWVVDCRLYNQHTQPNLSNTAYGIDNTCHDLKIINTEIYYTNCAILHNANVIIVSNCHLWSGGANVHRDAPATYGIRCTGNDRPNIMATGVYFDSFKYGIYRNPALPHTEIHAINCLFYIPSSSTFTDHVAIECHSTTDTVLQTQGCSKFAASGKELVEIDYGTFSSVFRYESLNVSGNFTPASGFTVLTDTSYVYNRVMYLQIIVTCNTQPPQDSVSNWYVMGTLDYDNHVSIRPQNRFIADNTTTHESYVGRVDNSNANYDKKMVVLAQQRPVAGNSYSILVAIPLR